MPRVGGWLLGAALASVASVVPAAQPPLANGVFLVARPELKDPNFRETVVLITMPQVGGGPLGVIINRPLGAGLSAIIPGAKLPDHLDAIYSGGPVRRERVLFLVRSEQAPEPSLHVLEDVYLSGSRELLEQLARGEAKATAFRAYAGYAGWAPGQLQAEIARGGWLVTSADAATIFARDPSRVWGELIRRLAARKARAASVAPGAPASVSAH